MAQRVAHGVAEVSVSGIAEPQRAAGVVSSNELVLEVGARAEQVEAGGEVAVEEVGLGEAELDLLAALRDREVQR